MEHYLFCIVRFLFDSFSQTCKDMEVENNFLVRNFVKNYVVMQQKKFR